MQDFLVTLLTCSITMSVLALVYMAFTPLLAKRYSQKGRYYAWLIIVIGLIIPFRPQFENPFVEVAMPVVPSEVAIPSAAAVPSVQFGDVTPITVPIGHTAVAPAPSSISWWQIAMVVWTAGAITVIAYHVIKHRRFVKMVNRWSECDTSEQTQTLVQNLRSEMGISKQIDVYRCSCVGSPMMIGFANARLLLPQADFAQDDLYFIIKHELVHFKRKDLYYKALVLLATAMHWFNPIVYLIAKTIDTQCELSCDAETVRGTDADIRRQYSETIIGVVKHQSKLKTALSTNFYGGKKGMKKRIFSIMDTGKKKTGVAILCCVLVLTIGAGMALAAQSPANGKSPADITNADQTDDTVTVNEDQTMMSYIDPATGKTMYSWDSGETWTALTDDEFEAMYPTDDIVWWTYDGYKAWMEEQISALKELADDGIPDYYDKTGALRDFTQSDVDKFAVNCQIILDRIKNGVQVSKTINGSMDAMISYDPRDIAIAHENYNALGAVQMQIASSTVLLNWPLEEHFTVTSTFGTKANPITAVEVDHQGIDISAPAGTAVLAAFDGSVERIYRDDELGLCVALTHGDNLQTEYAHLKDYAAGLDEGAQVNRGEVIGYVGATGKATGNVLHFGVKVDGEYIDPLSCFNVADTGDYDDYAAFDLVYVNGKLYYNGELVRCFDDWYSLGEGMQAGRSYFDQNGTVDVFAERDFSSIVHNPDGSYDPSGKLVGVRAAEQAEFDARDLTPYTEPAAPSVTTADSMRESLRNYERFGVSYDENAGMMMFDGLPVRELYDHKMAILITLSSGTGFPNSSVPTNAIDLKAVYDSDKLTGLRKSTQDEFDKRTRERTNAVATTYSISTDNASSIATSNATYETSESSGGRTIAEIFEDYAEFGVKFYTKSVKGGLGNIYYDGKLVKQFIDLAPDGGVFSCSSSDGGTITICTVYDTGGKITGVKVDGD